MRKILAIAAAVLATFSVSAQDSNTILDKIEKGLANQKEFKVNFSEKRVHPTKGEKDLKGNLIFKQEGFLQMNYDNGELFEIDGTKMIINRDKQKLILDLTKNLMMRNLSHALIYSFQGKLPILAKEQNSSISAAKEGKVYVVTLKATKKAVKGLNMLVVKYNVSDCTISEMTMEEFGGNTTYYKVQQ